MMKHQPRTSGAKAREEAPAFSLRLKPRPTNPPIELTCISALAQIAWISTLALLACSSAFAQGNVAYQVSGGPDGGAPGEIVTARTMAIGAFAKPTAPVTGAPYSATISTEFVQTLTDGNRIVNSSSGTVARDSQGRTRQDAPIPSIGNVSAANAPHIVFIQDPVAQVSYTLNLTDKTAQKMSAVPGAPMPGAMSGAPLPGATGGVAITASGGGAGVSGPVTAGAGPVMMQTFAVRDGDGGAPPPLPPLPAGGGPVFIQRSVGGNDASQVTTEDLGSQTMQGVTVTGTRTTRTIPAGQIGNDAAIKIVTEVWTSPDLKTVVYSKRDDPRMGEQTFQLTNITRAEPDASLFTVPGDFTVSDGPKPIIYKMNQ